MNRSQDNAGTGQQGMALASILVILAALTVLSMGLIVTTMFVWPWIDAWLRRVTGQKEISVYIGIVATCLLIGFTVWEAVVAH